MPTTIKMAKSTDELNDVLEVRYKALDQIGRKPNQHFEFTKKVIDHFDVYPTTFHIVVYRNGQVVGTCRALEFIPGDVTINQAFDFSESRTSLEGDCYLIDMVCVLKQAGNQKVLVTSLFKTLLSMLAHKNVEYAFFVCPETLLEDLKALGFKTITEVKKFEVLGFNAAPGIFDVRECYSRLVSGIIDQEIVRFQEVFYTIIFEPGEILITEGEKGSTSYLIEDGQVEVLVQKGDGLIPIKTIDKGQLVGEIAMVTNEPRTASIMAKTHASCIAFDRDDFMHVMYNNPQRSMDIFKIFSKRIKEINSRLIQSQSQKEVKK